MWFNIFSCSSTQCFTLLWLNEFLDACYLKSNFANVTCEIEELKNEITDLRIEYIEDNKFITKNLMILSEEINKLKHRSLIN